MALGAKLETTKDKNGVDLRIGSVCVYLAKPDDRDRDEYNGAKVIVRAIHQGDHSRDSLFGRPHLRVDTAIDKPEFDYGWSAWVNGDELVAI